MKKALRITGIFSILILTYANVNAQVQLDWARTFVGFGNQLFQKIAADNSGNVWVTGTTQASNGTNDIFIIKYNSAGTQTAGIIYNSPYNNSERPGGIATDVAGNVYVAGKANVNAGTADIFILKINSSGTILWSRIFSTAFALSIDDVEAIAVDLSGNVHLGGHVVKDVGFEYDYLTVKYSTDGVFQWQALYNGPRNGIDMISDIAVDANSNVYITGRSEGQIFIRGRAFSTGYDYATIKYDKSGMQQWVTRYTGTSTSSGEFGEALAVDASGYVYVTGTTTVSGSNNSNCATVKYDPTGFEKWAAIFNGPSGLNDFAEDLAVDGSGNVFVAGTVTNSTQDILAIKYDANGAQQWFRSYDTGPNYAESGQRSGLDPFGNFYITAPSAIPGVTNSDIITVKYTTTGVRAWLARYNSAANLSEGPMDIAVVMPRSSFPGAFVNANVYVTGTIATDALTLKYSQPMVIIRGSETETLPGTYAIGNTPNPFTGSTNIRYELPEDGRVSIIVYDVMGRKVSTLVNAKRSAGIHVERFDAGKLPDGIYHYQYTVTANGKEFRQTKGMVLQR